VLAPRPGDPRRSRVFVVVSRDALIGSKFTTVICAPVYSKHDGLMTQVPVGEEEGLKHSSSIHCDELVSLSKTALTNFVGSLGWSKLEALRLALMAALELEPLSS
jgi:mRNA interferase MazF